MNRRRMAEARICEEVRDLEMMTLDQLRQRWRQLFGPPPQLRSTELVRRLLSDKLQEQAAGRDPHLATRLRSLGKIAARGDRPKAPAPRLKVGTHLVRAWSGRQHRVEVTESGLLWEGREYRSLSEIARAITGTRWNGPLFFGLRETAKGPALGARP